MYICRLGSSIYLYCICLTIYIVFYELTKMVKSLFSSSRPRWVVPVLPKGELEVLLEAAIDLSKKGRNTHIVGWVCSVENKQPELFYQFSYVWLYLT